MPTKSLFDQIKGNPKYNQYNSYLWFQAKVREVFGGKTLTPQLVLQNQQAHLVNRILPGRMYTYVYDPKTKDKLPYYDIFPLVMPFNQNNYSFIGLNFHYLPYQMRLILLDKLMQFAIHNKGGELAYLRFSWALIGHASKLREVRPCVKRYLKSHVRSKFVLIEPNDWVVASMLPTENFKKARVKDVWRDSKNVALMPLSNSKAA